MTNQTSRRSATRRAAAVALAILATATPGLAQDGRRDVPAPPRAVDAAWGRYQDNRQGPEEVDRQTRTIKAGPNTWLDLANISGDIDVTSGSGSDIVLDMVKRVRARDGRSQELLAALTVDIVERPGRVEVRTVYPRGERRGSAWVDFTVRVPGGTSVSLKSVSGDIRVTSVKGELRVESVSGDVSVAGAGKLAFVRSVSGDVMLTDIASAGDLTAGSVSGDFTARGLEARLLDVNTVSGELTLHRVRCERAQVRSVSGTIEYTGPLARHGRYEMNSHSGDVRVSVPGDAGFEFEASTFSGNIQTEIPATVSGRDGGPGPASRSVRGTVGDASALVMVRTFSGDVSIRRQ